MIYLLPPEGCLGCNRRQAEIYFKIQGVPLTELREVDRRQPCSVECDSCGRAWLRVRPPVVLFQESVGPT